MSAIFCQISNLLIDKPEHSILTIEKKKGVYSLSVCNQSFSKMTQVTLNCLKEIIGEDRLKRIGRKPDIGIDVKKMDENTLVLTKNVVRKIFVGLLDVQKKDLDELPGHQSVEGKFRQLIFFDSLKDIESSLMGCCPDPNIFKMDRAQTSGKGFEGLIERIYISMQHHFKVIEENNKIAAELRDIEMLTSRLADREGSVFHLNEGYFYVDKVFIGGGAYISILQDVEGFKTPKIICRGTAMRRTATDGLKTGLNDILLEIGIMGIKNIWDALSKYLKESQITSIEILGKSLGGAHAQELAILIEGMDKIKVEKLITLCSVGVGKDINNLFKKEVLEKRESPFKIQVIRNGGRSNTEMDYIPAVGGDHLGEETPQEKCAIEVCYIQPGKEEVGIYPTQTGWFDLTRNLLRSFSLSHCRQTTLQEFSWKKINGRTQINEHLRIGNQLEIIRKCFAYIIHFLTLFLLNGKSFTSFFYAQQNERKSNNLERQQLRYES
jgi:hypothetical protein